jgi:hypothetical protein
MFKGDGLRETAIAKGFARFPENVSTRVGSNAQNHIPAST